MKYLHKVRKRPLTHFWIHANHTESIKKLKVSVLWLLPERFERYQTSSDHYFIVGAASYHFPKRAVANIVANLPASNLR